MNVYSCPEGLIDGGYTCVQSRNDVADFCRCSGKCFSSVIAGSQTNLSACAGARQVAFCARLRLLSRPIRAVEYKIDSPSDAHIEQFEKYTDDDIHNLMAYLQTLK